MQLLLLITTFFICLSTSYAGAINRCMGENGKIYFTDKLCKINYKQLSLDPTTGRKALKPKETMPITEKLGIKVCFTQIGMTKNEFFRENGLWLNDSDKKNKHKLDSLGFFWVEDYYCSVSFTDNIVVDIWGDIDSSRFSEKSRRAIDKYGEPTSSDTNEVSNLMGATFRNYLLTWNLPDGITYQLERFGNKVTQGIERIYISEYPKKYIKDTQE